MRSYRIDDAQKTSALRLIRDQQLTRFCNQLFASHAETRKRRLCGNHVANILPCDMGNGAVMYEFSADEVSLSHVVDTFCTRNNSDQVSALSTYLN